MPMINGKEVFYDIKKQHEIQKDIDQSKMMPADSKTELDISKLRKDLMRDEDDPATLSMFFDDASVQGMRSLNDRRGSYSVYRGMGSNEYINRSLEIIADDSTQQNDDGNVVRVFSPNEDIRKIGEELFVKKLDLNSELWNIIYNTAKFGDGFYEIIPNSFKDPKEIVQIRYLEQERTERIEIDSKLLMFRYTVDIEEKQRNNFKTGVFDYISKEKDKMIYKLFPWQVAHFKVAEDSENKPYGSSLLKPGIKTYRRLELLEDLMVTYRLSRSPEKRVFYVDVGNLSPSEARRFLNQMKDNYRSENVVDLNGDITKQIGGLSLFKDIFVPQREGGSGTRIEMLQGGTAFQNMDDINYFVKKILRTMNIPLEYLGEEANRTQSLSQMDQKFARYIERIQKQVVKTLNKMLAIELWLKGFKKDDLSNFTVELTPPSSVKEIAEVDIFNQKINLVSTIKALGLFPDAWILKKILKMSEREISDLGFQMKLQTGAVNADGTAAAGGDMSGGMGIGGDMGMGMGGDMSSGMGGDMGMGAPEGAMGGEVGAAPATEPLQQIPSTEPILASIDFIKQMYGKKFLVENKEDFLFFLKDLKNKSETQKESMLESLVEDINIKINKKYGKKLLENSVHRMILLGEFGGLSFKEKSSISIYKPVKDENGNGILEESKIPLQRKEYLKDE